jgi:toxin ParE1/3/4
VPRLVYRAAARRDIAEIAAYIERESQSRAVADSFIDKLTDYCEHIARLPGLVGRPRVELGRDYRSTIFGSYVIFLRYVDEGSPRSHLYITHVVTARATWTLISYSTPTTISRATEAVPAPWPHFPGLFSRSRTPGPPPLASMTSIPPVLNWLRFAKAARPFWLA